MRTVVIFFILVSLVFVYPLYNFFIKTTSNLYYDVDGVSIADDVVYFDVYQNPKTVGNLTFGKLVRGFSTLNNILDSALSVTNSSNPYFNIWYNEFVNDHFSLLDRWSFSKLGLLLNRGRDYVNKEGYFPFNIDLLIKAYPQYTDDFNAMRFALRSDYVSYVDGLGTLSFNIDGHVDTVTYNPVPDPISVENGIELYWSVGVYYHDYSLLDGVDCTIYGSFYTCADYGLIDDYDILPCWSVNNVIRYSLSSPTDNLLMEYYLYYFSKEIVSLPSSVHFNNAASLTDYVGFNYDSLNLITYDIIKFHGGGGVHG